MDILLRIFAGLMPTQGADPDKQYRYDLRMGITVSALFAVVAGAVILALGIFPGLSAGVAMNSDLRSVVAELKQNRAQTIDSQLLDLRIKHCQAKDETARQLYWSRIETLLQEYQRLTGQPWPLPACQDL